MVQSPDKDPRLLLRHLPPTDEVLAALRSGPGDRLSAAARTHLARRVLAGLRDLIEAGEWRPANRVEASARARREATAAVRRLLEPHPRPVINATGVLLHTNLGRAPLAEEAVRAMVRAAAGYTDLEYDLEAGSRGSRLARLEELLAVYTGAEAALAVNNNAAAVLLALNTLAEGREVIVSRGHLVEIGGSFRMPEIMARSGTRMVEVGTTNKTYLKDYERAIGRKTALILHVHQSNFLQQGFVHQVPPAELAGLGRRRGVPVLDDQGSGVLEDPGTLGAPGEPTVGASLEAGVTLVTCSGDKLLGGPQAGIVLGEREWVDRLKVNPLARAVRLEKLQIAALEATLRLYLTGEEDARVPVRRLARMPEGELKARASSLARALRQALREAGAGRRVGVRTAATQGALGGGTSPEVTLPGWGVVLTPQGGGLTAARLERALRAGSPPVIARVSEEEVILELRSVRPDQERRLPALVARAVKRAAVNR
jgi:L-seryl-tRNA(Ser) seleniumtransferase